MCIRDSIQDILERGNVVVLPQGVNAVIHGDIPHAVPWEEVLDQIPGLQVVPSQTAQILGNDKVDLPAFNGFQHTL